jgi:phenylacetate-CoA ligase
MHENRLSPGTDLNDQIKIIQNFKPDVIQGYGSVLNILAIKIIDDNIKIPKPKLLFTDSEMLIPEMRRNIQAAFSKDLIDIYGTFETDNIAYECQEHKGYHMTTDCVIIEFIKDEKPAGSLEEGEIVVTVLNNFAMPFIRYNMHDIGCYSRSLCTCGRTFPLMTKILGRSNDYMITKDGRKFSYFNIARFDKLAPHVKEYQIIQEDFDTFTVLIIPGKTYCNEGNEIIAPALKKCFPDAVVDINLVIEIRRESSGKFKAFKSKIKV